MSKNERVMLFRGRGTSGVAQNLYLSNENVDERIAIEFGVGLWNWMNEE